MDEMPEEQRREVLRLLLDGENNVNLTLAIPTEEFISIEKPILRSRSRLFSLSRLLDHSASHANTVHTGPVLACGCDLDGRASRTHKLLGVEEGDAHVIRAACVASRRRAR